MPNVSQQKPSRKRPAKKATNPKITKLTDGDAPIKMLIYGRSGTGKTTLWSTFPGPVLVLIASGIKDPGEWYSIAKKDRAKIDKWELSGYDDAVEALDYAKKNTHYKTIVVDHATGLHDFNLMQEIGVDSLPVQRDWGDISRDQYRVAGKHTLEMLREFLGLQHQNLVVIAQERRFENEDKDESELDIIPEITANVPAAVAGWLSQSVNYAVHTFIKQRVEKKKVAGKETQTRVKGKVDFCLRTTPHPVYYVKFRVPRGSQCPEFITDPTYNKLRQVIDGEYKEPLEKKNVSAVKKKG